MIAAALVGKKILFTNIQTKPVQNVIKVLKQMGVKLIIKNLIILKSDKIKALKFPPNLILDFLLIYRHN